MPDKSRIGIVICTSNRREALMACLDAVAKQDYPPGRLGVWVYDDGSTDGTSDAAAVRLRKMKEAGLGAGAVISPGLRAGISNGRNAAARLALEKSDLLLFLDDDVLPAANCVSGLASLMQQRPEVGIAAPLVLRSDDSRPLHGPYFVSRLTFRYSSGDSRAETFCDWVDPACVMVSPGAFSAAGGFWPGYYRSHEGVDLCLRAGKSGCKVLYYPAVSAVHLMRQETLSPDRLYYLFRNKFTLIRRNGAAWHRKLLIPFLAAAVLPKYLLEAAVLKKRIASADISAVACAVLDGLSGREGPRPGRELEALAAPGKPAGKPDFHLDVLVSGLVEIVNMAIRFFASVLVARSLGAEGRGVYALALAAPGLLLGFTSIGLGEATTVLLGKGKYPRERVIGSMNFLVLLMGLLGFAVYFGLSPLILKALRHSMPWDVYVMAFCVFPLTLYWGGNASVALGFSLVRRVSWGRLLNNAVFLALILALYFNGPGVKAVLGAFLFAFLAENIYLLYYIKKESRVGLRYDLEMIKEQARLGWHVFWGGMFLQVTKRLDILLVNFFLGPGPLGVYVVAYSMAEFVLAVPGIYSRAAFSSAAVSTGGEGFSISNAAIRQTLFLMVALAAALALVMKPFILTAYTAEFLPAVLPALVLLPGVIMFGFGSLMGNIFTGYARPQEITKAAAISCAGTVALDFFLIPRYGITGAAVASTLAYGAGSLWLFFSYLRFSKVPAMEILAVRREDFFAYRDKLHRIFKG